MSISNQGCNKEINNYNVYTLDDEIPTCFRDISKSQNKNKWEKAIEEELNSLDQNQTWTLVQKPNNVNMIDSK